MWGAAAPRRPRVSPTSRAGPLPARWPHPLCSFVTRQGPRRLRGRLPGVRVASTFRGVTASESVASHPPPLPQSTSGQLLPAVLPGQRPSVLQDPQLGATFCDFAFLRLDLQIAGGFFLARFAVSPEIHLHLPLFPNTGSATIAPSHTAQITPRQGTTRT